MAEDHMRALCPINRLTVLGTIVVVTGCTPATLPFQPRSGSDVASYGYSDTKLDATHYAIAYADKNAERAGAFLELRAAQIAQFAGFRYFAFEKRDHTVVVRTVSDLSMDDVRQHAHDASGRPFNPMEMVPGQTSSERTIYYYATGHIAFLTDDQARGHAGAMAVSDVLARATTSPEP
jgi:hypothetical protein